MRSTNLRITGLLQTFLQCLLLVALCSSGAVYSASAVPGAPAAGQRLAPPAALDAYRKQPMVFERNEGQTDPKVDFIARGAGYTAFLTAKELVVGLHTRNDPAILRMSLVDGNPSPQARGAKLLPGTVNYANGNDPDKWLNVPTYAEVVYDDVYPGIGLVYHGRQRQLEYDFVVAPGANPQRIRLAFAGVSALQVDADGALVLDTAAGQVRKPRPVIYQEIEGVRRAVDGRYVVDDADRVGFELGRYDPTHTLVIDPLVLYSTYLGGHADEAAAGIAVDAAGNFYVTGTTTSVDFPRTTARPADDVFVTKFNAAGQRVYSTYFGTPCDDSATAIALDAGGNAYITGRAWEGWCDAEPPVPDYPGVYVAKLNPTGGQVYFFFFGPDDLDSAHGKAIAVDNAGQAYVTGGTRPYSGFPTTPGAYRRVGCGGSALDFADVFVAKINAAGTALVYSTLLCGGGQDLPEGIAVDAAGNAYVAGTTDSRDFPTLNAYQGSNRAPNYRPNGFVTKLNATGSALVYSTYLGGGDDTSARGIAVDASGQAHVTGWTTARDFPTTPGVVQPTPGSRACTNGLCTDAFVTKLGVNGTGLVYSTFLFGDLDDEGVGIAVDNTGHAYVVGSTDSPTFPILQAFRHRKADTLGYDAFVTKLNPTGSAFVYSSYLGGSTINGYGLEGDEQGVGIAVDGTGNAYVTGITKSFNFPTTAGAVQPAFAAGFCGYYPEDLCGDAFVTKIAASGPGVTPALRVTVSPASVSVGGTITASWAGLPSPGAQDELRLYPVGSYFHEHLAQWLTTGAASGTLTRQLPGSAVPGWYEVRLLRLDDYDNSMRVVARSDAFRVIAAPDLRVTAVGNPPANATLGSTFAVTDTVRNEGTAATGASTTRYYLSLDTLKGSGDVRLTGTRAVGSLASGAQSAGTANVTVPSATKPGAYFLLTCADDTNVIVETDEADNCRSAVTKVTAVAPDLVEAALGNPPASARPGTSFALTDTVRNQGNAQAPATTTRYYLSRDALKGSGDVLLATTRFVPSLAVGVQSTGSVIVSVPAGASGSYFVLGCADDLAAVVESSETNNCRASASMVAVAL